MRLFGRFLGKDTADNMISLEMDARKMIVKKNISTAGRSMTPISQVKGHTLPLNFSAEAEIRNKINRLRELALLPPWRKPSWQST